MSQFLAHIVVEYENIFSSNLETNRLILEICSAFEHHEGTSIKNVKAFGRGSMNL